MRIEDLKTILQPFIQYLIEDYLKRIKINYLTTDDAAIELGVTKTGNRVCYIDLHGDDTYTDYSLRILRSSTGSNAPSSIIHRGTGDFTLLTNEAGRILFSPNNSLALYLDTAQRVVAKSGIFWLKRDLTDLTTRRNWSLVTEVLNQGDFAIGVSSTNTGDPTGSKLNITSGGFVGIGNNFAATHLLQLSTDDAAKPTTNTWTVVSDARTKRNIKQFAGGLGDLLKFPSPVSFEYNGLGGTPEGDKGIGFLAQDMQGVKPEWVKSSRGKLNKNDATDTDILALNTGDMQFLMLNAIKELSAKLDAQEQRIKTLENQVTALQARLNNPPVIKP